MGKIRCPYLGIIACPLTAFGSRRGSAWQDQLLAAEWTTITATTRRGFTGHEHLDNLSLVHMNGRVYDPQLGRFLSADPVYGGDLASPQTLNPYSYVGNNPLSAVDPSGLASVGASAGCAGNPFCGDDSFDNSIIVIAYVEAGLKIPFEPIIYYGEPPPMPPMPDLPIDEAPSDGEPGEEPEPAPGPAKDGPQSNSLFCETVAKLGGSFGGQLAGAIPGLGGFLGVDVIINPFNLQVGITTYGGGGVNLLPTPGILATVGWGGSWGLQTNGPSQGVGGIVFGGVGPGASVSMFSSTSGAGGSAAGGLVGGRGAEGFALGAAAIGGDYYSKTIATEGVCHE